MINRFYLACPQLIGKGLSRVNSRLVKISYILFVLYHKIPVSTASTLVFLLMIEQIQSNFKGEVLMNRRTEMGGVRVERTQYRRWGGGN